MADRFVHLEAELLPAGSMLLAVAMDVFGLKDLTTSDWALPMTPGSSRATDSTMARTATSPPLST